MDPRQQLDASVLPAGAGRRRAPRGRRGAEHHAAPGRLLGHQASGGRTAPAPPDEMFVILASPLTIEPEAREWKTEIHVGARAAGILVNQIYREDLDYAHGERGGERVWTARSALIAALGQVSADALLARVPYRFRPPDYREVRLWTVVPSVSFSEPLQFEPSASAPLSTRDAGAARNRLDGRPAGSHRADVAASGPRPKSFGPNG